MAWTITCMGSFKYKAVTMDAGGNFISGEEAPLGIADKQMVSEAAGAEAEKVNLEDI